MSSIFSILAMPSSVAETACSLRSMKPLSATEARALAAERPPEIAICDWGLGGTESGVDVARFLQQKFGTRLIFVTAQPRAALRAAVRDLEVERVLQKPISLRVLAGIVRSLHD